MKAVLISIGCDHYDQLQRLNGAEADARKVFEALTDHGQPYAKESSRLLLSPTKGEVDAALLGIDAPEIDVLTLYFAGHGTTSERGYYFCLKDTRSDRLSLTGLPLNAWINLVRELRPRYSYLVADSCESGGSHHDLRDILSDPRVGKASATTFACLAASSADQYAHEVEGAGIMTAELLKALDGRLSVSAEPAELDLMDVARVVGARFEDVPFDQRPIAWGLNLYGPGRFCRNPHYSNAHGNFHVPNVPVGSLLAQRAAKRSDDLWELYRSVSKGVDYTAVLRLVRDVTRGGEISAAERGSFIFGLAQAVSGRLRACGLSWDAAEAFGAFAAFMLPDVRHDASVAALASELLRRKARMELDLVIGLPARLADSSHHLLSKSHTMGDLFYLPLRIVKLLATIAQVARAAPELGLPVDTKRMRSAVASVLANYPLALRAVSDEQAAPLFVWFQHASALGWRSEVEEVFGSVFSDFVEVKGKMARCGLSPTLACEYLLARGRDAATIKQAWLANPGSLLAVLLIAACDCDFDDVVDEHLDSLDHQRLNLYFPAYYRSFAEPVIEDGVNRTFEIGRGIWLCSDFRSVMDDCWRAHVSTSEPPQSSLESMLVVCAALVFPDRLPLSLRIQNM